MSSFIANFGSSGEQGWGGGGAGDGGYGGGGGGSHTAGTAAVNTGVSHTTGHGGAGGLGGQAGGFIYIKAESISIPNSSLLYVSTKGGNGASGMAAIGAGSNGGNGGNGVDGLCSGSTIFPASGAGAAGRGGDGGYGGNGGDGGDGGFVWVVVKTGNTDPLSGTNMLFTPGTGGSGGSHTNAGATGTDGTNGVYLDLCSGACSSCSPTMGSSTVNETLDCDDQGAFKLLSTLDVDGGTGTDGSGTYHEYTSSGNTNIAKKYDNGNLVTIETDVNVTASCSTAGITAIITRISHLDPSICWGPFWDYTGAVHAGGAGDVNITGIGWPAGGPYTAWYDYSANQLYSGSSSSGTHRCKPLCPNVFHNDGSHGPFDGVDGATGLTGTNGSGGRGPELGTQPETLASGDASSPQPAGNDIITPESNNANKTTIFDGTGMPSQTDVILSPNPATETIVLSFDAPDNALYTITISDMTGRQVYDSKYVAQKGKSQLSIDINPYAKGEHIVRLVHATTHQQIHFIKQ